MDLPKYYNPDSPLVDKFLEEWLLPDDYEIFAHLTNIVDAPIFLGRVRGKWCAIEDWHFPDRSLFLVREIVIPTYPRLLKLLNRMSWLGMVSKDLIVFGEVFAWQEHEWHEYVSLSRTKASTSTSFLIYVVVLFDRHHDLQTSCLPYRESVTHQLHHSHREECSLVVVHRQEESIGQLSILVSIRTRNGEIPLITIAQIALANTIQTRKIPFTLYPAAPSPPSFDFDDVPPNVESVWITSAEPVGSYALDDMAVYHAVAKIHNAFYIMLIMTRVQYCYMAQVLGPESLMDILELLENHRDTRDFFSVRDISINGLNLGPTYFHGTSDYGKWRSELSSRG